MSLEKHTHPQGSPDPECEACMEALQEEPDTIIYHKTNNTMKEIQTIHLSRLQQEEAYHFHTLVLQDFEKCTHDKFTPVLTTFKDSLASFEAALKPTIASVRTNKLVALDERRDTAWRKLNHLVNYMLDDLQEAKRDAAETLKIILNKYGDPTQEPYIKESGILDNFLIELEEPKNHSAIALLGGGEWLNELKTTHSEFVKQFYDRGSEQSELVTDEWRQARKEVDAAYKACVKRLNAMAEWEGVETIATIIQYVNERIDYQKQVLAARKTRNETKNMEKSK